MLAAPPCSTRGQGGHRIATSISCPGTRSSGKSKEGHHGSKRVDAGWVVGGGNGGALGAAGDVVVAHGGGGSQRAERGGLSTGRGARGPARQRLGGGRQRTRDALWHRPGAEQCLLAGREANDGPRRSGTPRRGVGGAAERPGGGGRRAGGALQGVLDAE